MSAYYPFSGLKRGKCLWVLFGGTKPCRFLAKEGMFCEKHEKQWWLDMVEAMKHPEKWVLVEEKTADGKVWRDYVYRP